MKKTGDTGVRYEQMLLTLLILLPLTLIEGLWYWRTRRAYPWKEVGASVLVNIGQRLIGLASAGFILGASTFVFDHRVTTMSMDKPIHWIALFFCVEFAYYWFHRWSHEIRWLWTSHSVHHTPNSINFPGATRLGWTGFVTGAWLFWLPLMWFGFPPTYVLGMLAANLVYQFWLHTEMIPKLHPAFEWFFNSPSHHRVHHGANIEYLDANYGGVVMIFDRMFGTFIGESTAVKIRYGLVKPQTSFNPFTIALGEMKSTLVDV